MATGTGRPWVGFRLPSQQDREAVCSARRGIHLVPVGAAATRKPRLSFRFSGSFLLRFAARQFLASLFQLPPRITRPVACGRSPAVVLAQRGGNAKIWHRRRG